MSAPDDGASGGADRPPTGAEPLEPLACVSCRARKLKCDRTRPACTRCTRVEGDCVYPESRRKPTYKRRNVKELEARLAQVETLLGQVNGAPAEPAPGDGRQFSLHDVEAEVQVPGEDVAFSQGGARVESIREEATPPDQVPFNIWNDADAPGLGYDTSLIGLGMSESLPPWEVIQELTESYFKTSHYFFPIIHPGRYLQSFYGGPLMQPPMGLQYMVWAVAAIHHDKYSGYADVFYKRAKTYIDQEEMKGDGEHFVNIQHAQALGLLATYEAKHMLFTRAAMNTAKYVRIAHMMSLDRLDTDEENRRPPALSPPMTWVETEERRRVFWGAFAIDAHSSVSTGWPSLINVEDVTTRLPASEEAFRDGREERTHLISEIYDGAPYSSFASTLVNCNVYKEILHLIHRPRPDDRPQDFLNGLYWKKHRELDNKVLTLFMFLPDQFRLTQNSRDAAAIHLNMNLHASVICLHHAAIAKMSKYNLPSDAKEASLRRMMSSAVEIASIAKTSAHLTPIFKSPLCAMSLYTATTVFVYMAKEDPVHGLSPVDLSNFDMIVRLMEAISRFHEITKAFLMQVGRDIEKNGLSHMIRSPTLRKMRATGWNLIPLVTRTSVAEHSETPAVLPGRLPLRNPQDPSRVGSMADVRKMARAQGDADRRESYAVGIRRDTETLGGSLIAAGQLLEEGCFSSMLGSMYNNLEPSQPTVPATSDPANHSHKRKRTSQSPGAGGGGQATAKPAHSGTMASGTGPAMPGSMAMPARSDKTIHMTLPDRSGSSAASSPAHRGSSTAETFPSGGSSHNTTPPGMLCGLGNSIEENTVDLRPFQGRVAAPLWDNPESFMFGQVTDDMVAQVLQDSSEDWGLMMEPELQWPGSSIPNV